MLRRELPTLAVGDQFGVGNAEKRIVRFVIVTGGEERFVGGNERQSVRIGEIDQLRLGEPLSRHAMALQLDIDAIAEQALQDMAARGRNRMLSGNDGTVERTARATGQRNQSGGAPLEPRQLEVRPLLRGGVEISA